MSKVLDMWSGMTGTVLSFAGSTAPDGWLLCYGQAVSRTTYANLFAAIGTTFGVGNGTTTFNVPDLRGRVAAGKDNMGGTAASRLTATGTGHPGIDGSALGAVGGADRHALAETQMPLHAHDTNQSGSSGNINFGTSGSSVTRNQATPTGGGAESGQLTQEKGSSQAHPNAQPTIVLNSIIKV